MKSLIIHPTHRKMLRLLRDRYEEGRPVILLKNEVDGLFKALPSFQSPTSRNQFVYRTLLRAINRPLSDIQQSKGFILIDNRVIRKIEKIYARVERNHLCYTMLSTMELYLVRRRLK